MRIACLRLLLAPLAVLLAVVFSSGTAHAQSCPPATGKYKVKIDSAPTGATVYLGSKQCPAVGVTPWNGSLGKGDFTVIIEAQGYDQAQRVFKVAAVRKVQELFVPLVKRPQIEIRADADPNLIGAAVTVDGQPSGVVQGPLVIPTTAARHLVEIKKEGYQPLSQWVDLTTNPSLVLAPALVAIPKPKYGTIVVEADVQDAEVFIDGNKHPDNTPSVINNVIEGVHVIEVKKAPAPPWRATVTVEANKQTKVRAEIAPLLHGGVGVVRVLSDAQGARAYLDGIDMGPLPVDIKDVKAGDHIIQVKAPGYQTGEKTVTVRAGQSEIVKFDLNTSTDQGTIKIASTVPEAEVFIDGVAVGKVSKELSEQGWRGSVGEHLVVVKHAGYKEYSTKVRIEGGKPFKVEARLEPVGKLLILAKPDGATVTINGVPLDKRTPITDLEIEAGDKVVRIEFPGFEAFEQTVKIEGGKTQTLSPKLELSRRSDSELAFEQKGLSSFGARTLPRGRSTVDFDIGYPHFFGGRISVGAGRIAKRFGFDATVGVRIGPTGQELGLGARMMLVDQNPFSAGLFTNFWWGSMLLDNSARNGVTFEGGAIASLTALSNVTISGRAYLQLWSDRHCPELLSGRTFEKDTDPTQICEDIRANTALPEDKMRAEKLTGNSGDAFFDRDSGARLMLSVIAEVSVRQHWNLFGILEGAPFQDERALFTSLFSGVMPDQDAIIYARIGLSYKF